MTVNRARLDRDVAQFLRSDEAGQVFDEMETPLAERLLWMGLMLIFLVFSLGSIVGIVFLVPRLRNFERRISRYPWGNLRKSPERLYPMIVHGVIIGPTGEGLVLGTFDQELETDERFLSRKASMLAHLYANGSPDPRNEEIVTLLKDDAYHRDRRRRVVGRHAEGKPLLLFDMRIDLKKARSVPDAGVLIACVVTPGKEGMIQQIPWRVVENSVKVATLKAAKQPSA